MSAGKWALAGLFTMCTLVSATSQTTNAHAPGTANGPCSPSVDQLGGGSDSQQPCLDTQDRVQLAGRFVASRLALWQQRLNLEDWQISVLMTRRSELKPKTRGKIRWDKDKKTAVICVMDASDYQLPQNQMLDDMEFTIVHELIHLELASLPRSEASRSTEERAVNRIAETLLRLARQK